MPKLILVLAPALLLTACAEAPRQSFDQGPFIGLNDARLSEGERRVLTDASEDFKAVVAGKKPVHAILDKNAPLPSDGGSTFYNGDGYRLTVLESLSSFGGFHGTAYGPIIRFQKSFAPGNTAEVSDIRIYSREEFSKLAGRHK
jgi:hypothetical protein